MKVFLRAMRTALVVAMLGVSCIMLAPVQLGGGVSYVITSGTSMLPTYRANGLILVRQQERSNVDDVVAYQNRQLGAVVMHRIVAIDGDRFILKGDNNDFLDQYRPRQDDIVGEPWVYIPRAGGYVSMLRSPLTFAAIIALITLGSVRPASRARRRRHHHAA